MNPRQLVRLRICVVLSIWFLFGVIALNSAKANSSHLTMSTPAPVTVKKSTTVKQMLPGDSAMMLPTLNNEIDTYWPNLTPRWFPAAIIDQESNWKQKATLRVKQGDYIRELGCGYGQFTIAYDAKGNPRFDALTETKRLDRSLAGWSWHDCYNAQYQLRAVVLKLKVNNRNCLPLMRDNRNVKACAGAMYNGGPGSITKRIRTCRMTPGCQPDIWYGQLDQLCAQSNVKAAGYGESFCQINSKYPKRVEDRQYKFKGVWPNDPVFGEEPKKK